MRPVHSHPVSRWRMTCGRGVALAALLSASLAASALAAGDEFGDPAIPPGEEELIGAMLGRGMTFHDCTLTSGGVQYTVIKATYNCLLGGEVTFELAHPRNAAGASTLTGQFAIKVQSGSPPPAFQEALTSLIRSQEANFVWSWPAYEGAGGNTADGGAAE
jgi:hypothetical protein